MPPPSIPQAEPEKDSSPVKPPRPNTTIGLLERVVVEYLLSQGLSNNKGQDLLDDLQQARMDRDTRKQPEPVLCSQPSQRALGLHFPFLIIEGRSFATVGHIYEAENQVAVSGACALKIQHDLDELVDLACQGSGYENHAGVSPLFFSICTQGPFHELWAYYDILEDDVRIFYMVMVASCRAPVRRDAL